MFDPQTAFFVTGLLYIAMPLTAWSILRQRHDRRSVALWCGGGLCYGIGVTLVGLRGTIPDWLSFMIANPLSFGAYGLRIAALRRELSQPERPAQLVLVWGGMAIAYLLAYKLFAVEAPRVALTSAFNMLGAVWLCSLAWAVYRRHGYRSAALLTSAYVWLAGALVLRGAVTLLHWGEARVFSAGPDFVLLFLAAIFAALYGNLGYIGMALEASRQQELARENELAREQERRQQIERSMREQGALLAERDRLLQQREEVLQAMAHEVRQPLNNAMAAMQSALSSIDRPTEHGAAEQRLKRANSVLMRVIASLDNTLADAVMLGHDAPMARQDIDVATLIDLVIADLDPDVRGRVRVELTAQTRTASLNPGLMRLALRNLIGNALIYSPAGTPVTIHVADHEDSLALQLDVSDQGSGIAPDLVPRLFGRGVRGKDNRNPYGHGLGLHIVRRVMEMHGGSVCVARNGPGGLTMRATLPLMP